MFCTFYCIVHRYIKKVLWKICDVKNAKSGFLRQCLFRVVYCSICFKLKIVYGRKLIRWKKYLFFLEKRQRGRFAGFSLNVSNTDLSKTEVDENSTLCYKDGPLLPFLHFTTTTCAMIGRYVTFYNERFDKQTFPAEYEVYNVFTELCEVFIFGKSIFFKYTAIIETENATLKYCILEINSNSNLYFYRTF